MSRRFRCEYKLTERFGRCTHQWTCVGRHGALHLHINEGTDQFGPSGGIEIHYRAPPDYMANDAPSHDECWLLKQPCWHDGSSLQASEYWIPRWMAAPHEHSEMFRRLEAEYRSRFEKEDEA
jgi:hypothetical protein